MKAYKMQNDSNQPEIVKALRKLGYSVLIIGQPLDLLVSSPTDMWLVEIKTKAGKLNSKQEDFILKWRGKPIIIARSLEECLEKMKV